ncbi:thioredoxin domain-containing protein 15 [Dermacentor albipictus]|uniref:thioredoxin domain-containing protein 15 n=1 Tax=Dermacentor albipictus TaxID=60249 RepID=UPI0038FC1645
MAPVSFWCCVFVVSLFSCQGEQVDEIVVTSSENTEDVVVNDPEVPGGQSVLPVDHSAVDAAAGDAETNSTANDTNNSTETAGARNASSTTNPIRCLPSNASRNESDEFNALQLINGTALLQELSPAPNKTNSTSGRCIVVTFYSPYCNFCASAAPYVNALPAGFPDLEFYAVDVVKSSHINMRYGLVAVPSILLFHNGRAVAKFNDTFVTMQGLMAFVTRHTGMQPSRPLDPDYNGPLADKPLEYTDWVLVSAWLFTIVCAVGAFLRSSLCKRMVASVQNAWREAQHQHQD